MSLFKIPHIELQKMIESGQINDLIGQILLVIIILTVVIYIHSVFTKFLKTRLSKISEEGAAQSKKIIRIINMILILILALLGIQIFSLDYTFFETHNLKISVSFLVTLVLIIQIARLVDMILYYLYIDIHAAGKSYANKEVKQYWERQKPKEKRRRTAQYIAIVYILRYLFQNLGLNYTIFHNETEDHALAISFTNILDFVMVILVAQLIVWVTTKIILEAYYQRHKINIGNQFAINQIVTYFIYVIAIIVGLETMGIEMTIIWGGLAALLVGVGLGLQQTFNDFFSGIILLLERSVEVGDVIQLDNEFGVVTEIGLRASVVKTRDAIHIIVPNGKLVTQSVINYSHFENKTRYGLQVGVSYSEDPEQIRKILLEAAKTNEDIFNYPEPVVLFTGFGDSALMFELRFYCSQFLDIQRILSELRYTVFQSFKEEGVTIPFPQMDVWMKSTEGFTIPTPEEK